MFYIPCYRFLGGKNKVLQIGLGRDKADEQSKNLHLLSEQLVGQRCLLFTDASNEDILRCVDNIIFK